MSEPAESTSGPFVTRAGEGSALWHLDNLTTFKAVAAATGNRLAVWEQLLPRHSSPPLHVHHRDDEAWYVLDGRLSFTVDGTYITAAAGDFVWAPRGLPHSFRVDSDTARLLGLGIPAGFEEFFFATGRPAAERTVPPAPTQPPDLATLAAHARAAGCDVVGPPMTPTDEDRLSPD